MCFINKASFAPKSNADKSGALASLVVASKIETQASAAPAQTHQVQVTKIKMTSEEHSLSHICASASTIPTKQTNLAQQQQNPDEALAESDVGEKEQEQLPAAYNTQNSNEHMSGMDILTAAIEMQEELTKSKSGDDDSKTSPSDTSGADNKNPIEQSSNEVDQGASEKPSDVSEQSGPSQNNMKPEEIENELMKIFGDNPATNHQDSKTGIPEEAKSQSPTPTKQGDEGTGSEKKDSGDKFQGEQREIRSKMKRKSPLVAKHDDQGELIISSDDERTMAQRSLKAQLLIEDSKTDETDSDESSSMLSDSSRSRRLRSSGQAPTKAVGKSKKLELDSEDGDAKEETNSVKGSRKRKFSRKKSSLASKSKGQASCSSDSEPSSKSAKVSESGSKRKSVSSTSACDTSIERSLRKKQPVYYGV